MGFVENYGLNHKFYVCDISWVIIENIENENLTSQLTQNSNTVRNFYLKIKKLSQILTI